MTSSGYREVFSNEGVGTLHRDPAGTWRCPKATGLGRARPDTRGPLHRETAPEERGCDNWTHPACRSKCPKSRVGFSFSSLYNAFLIPLTRGGQGGRRSQQGAVGLLLLETSAL